MKQEEGKGLELKSFPALQEFLPAYLHEDFGEEYESAAEAVKGFLAEAGGDEIERVKDEWRRLRETLAGRPFGEVQSAIRLLGGAWQPADEAEWQNVSEILSRIQA